MRRHRDERGSLPLAMLVTVVSVGLSAVLATVLTSAVINTRSEVQGVRAVNAARAGLAIGLARVLEAGTAAISTSGGCSISGTTTTGQYSVTLKFYASSSASAHCPLTGLDRYAQITSTGTDGKNGVPRTLTADYAFPLGDVSRPTGGVIRFADAAGGTCLASSITLQVCSSSDVTQNWVYGTDLTLSQIDLQSLTAYCLKAGSATTLAAKTMCNPLDTAQQWVFNGRTFTNVSFPSSCIDALTGTAGTSLTTLGTGARCTATVGMAQTWFPENKVSAGYAADPLSLELVNGADFGRCLDAAGSVSVQPCSQNKLAMLATSKWIMTPVLGTSTVTLSSGGKCLTTGQAGLTAPVSMANCTGAVDQRWTAPEIAGIWKDSFQIREGVAGGRCLSSSTTVTGAFATAAQVTECTDARAQKWNVDSRAFLPALTKITEK